MNYAQAAFTKYHKTQPEIKKKMDNNLKHSSTYDQLYLYLSTKFNFQPIEQHKAID